MTKKPTRPRDRRIQAFEHQVNIAFEPRDGIFVARVPELENCHTHGNTPEEALNHAKDASELWIQTAHEQKIPIPEPMSQRKFSGKFVVLSEEGLHASLAREALRSGKSMNELAVELLSKGLKKII